MKTTINVESINQMAQQDIWSVIQFSERKYHDEIFRVASHIDELKKQQKIVLIAGPSASGKTTTAALLFQYLENLGVRTAIISLDDFFKNKADTPILPNGQPDFESVNTLDIDCLHKCFKQMIENGKTEIPHYDFKLGRRNGGRELSISDHVVIVEGIHALNPAIIPDGFGGNMHKVYISVRSQFENDGKIVITARNMRLIRRALRDYKHRNQTINSTLNMWQNVIDGEEQYILPFRKYAHDVIDSIHLYEPMIYKEMIAPLLEQNIDDNNLKLLNKIAAGLNCFLSASIDMVPNNSLINEFIK